MDCVPYVLLLPSAVLSRILAGLDCEDLSACACACRAWRSAAADDAVWRASASRRFPGFRAAPLPRGSTHRLAVAAACRAATSAAQRSSSVWALKDFTIAVELWWGWAAQPASLRPVFAASWPAEALFEREEGLTQEGCEASDAAEGSPRPTKVTAPCVLNEGESVAQELVKCLDDGISDWDQVVLSPRILARRSDGAVAVICSCTDADPMDCDDLTFGWWWDSTLFFLFPRCRDDTAETVIIELTVELSKSGRQPSVARLSIDAMRNRPACEPAYLLWALERTVPWARCPPPSLLQAAARCALPPPPPSLDAASPLGASSAQTILSCVMSRLDGTALAACACVCRAWRASVAVSRDASLHTFPSLSSTAASLAAARRAVARASRHVSRWQAQRDHFGAASEWALADFVLSIEVWWAPESVGGEGHDEAPQAASLNDAAARPVFAASFPALRLADASTTEVPCELADGESALATFAHTQPLTAQQATRAASTAACASWRAGRTARRRCCAASRRRGRRRSACLTTAGGSPASIGVAPTVRCFMWRRGGTRRSPSTCAAMWVCRWRTKTVRRAPTPSPTSRSAA